MVLAGRLKLGWARVVLNVLPGGPEELVPGSAAWCVHFLFLPIRVGLPGVPAALPVALSVA